MKHVKSGRKLMLIYNLCHGDGACPSAHAAIDAHDRLRSLVGSWSKTHNWGCGGAPNILAYVMESYNIQGTLSYDILKSQDRHVIDHLKQVCSDSNCYLYVAEIERSAHGGCDNHDYNRFDHCHSEDDYSSDPDEIYELTGNQIEIEFRLLQVVDLTGNAVEDEIQIKEEDFIQANSFHRCPDELIHDHGDGYATHIHRNTVSEQDQ